MTGTQPDNYQMNIDRLCDEPCRSGNALSTATPAGIQLLRDVLDLLGRPDKVDYTDIVDAHTPKNESGVPCHTEGFQQYLDLGTDVTCLCVLRSILQQLGYAEGESGNYVREAAG
jgi:hypothetical protein